MFRMNRPQSAPKRTTAVVIGSGGIKCAASIGLWSVLRREGIEPSLAVGASGGSIYAALIALNMDPGTAEAQTADLWTPELMRGYSNRLRAVLSGESRFTEQSGLIDPEPTRDALYKVFGERTFADTRLPLCIVCTDLYSGEPVVLNSGKLLDAILASIAIPMLYPPRRVGDRLLVDGAASDPLPVDVAIREGGEVIMAMGFEMPTRTRMRSYTSVASHFNSIYMNHILRATFAFSNLAHHGEVIPVLPEFEGPTGTYSAGQIAHLVEAGARATEEALPHIRQALFQTR
jgi:NTE family protein